MSTYQVINFRKDVDNETYSIYSGSMNAENLQREGQGILREYRKQDNKLLRVFEGSFYEDLKDGFGTHENEFCCSVGIYESDLLEGCGFMKFLSQVTLTNPLDKSKVYCKKDEVFIGLFIRGCPTQRGLWYRSEVPVVSMNRLSYYHVPLHPRDIAAAENQDINSHYIFDKNLSLPIHWKGINYPSISQYQENGAALSTFFPHYPSNQTCKGRIVTYTDNDRWLVKSRYYGDLNIDTAANPPPLPAGPPPPPQLPKREGFGRLQEYHPVLGLTVIFQNRRGKITHVDGNKYDIEFGDGGPAYSKVPKNKVEPVEVVMMECVGVWNNDALVKGTYKSVMEHDVPNQSLKKWNAGVEYEGEFRNCMMHGKGELKISGSNGQSNILRGTFADHVFQKMNDYSIFKFKNDNLFHMEVKDGSVTYSGAAVQLLQLNVPAYLRHGTGIYECSDYKYDGEWSEGMRHGRGKFTCRRADFLYFPFEAGDEYDGHFVVKEINGTIVEVADGICVEWEHPNKFKYVGEVVNNCPTVGEYESLTDHYRHDCRGSAVLWKSGWKYKGCFYNFMMHGKGVLTKSEAGRTINEIGTFINHILCKEDGQDYRVEARCSIIDAVDLNIQHVRDNVATKYIGRTNIDNISLVNVPGKVYTIGCEGYRVEQGRFNGLDHTLDQQKDYSTYIYKGVSPVIPYKLMEIGVCVNPADALQSEYSVTLERKHNFERVVGEVELRYVRILHLSDTQNLHDTINNLPDADILVHTGDFTKSGTESEYRLFNQWLNSVSSRYPHRVVIPGDLDVTGIFARSVAPSTGAELKEILNGLLSNATVLMHESVDINVSDCTTLKFYGSPWCYGHDSERPGDTASCRDYISNMVHRFDEIPENVDVLLTHCAPRTILDDKTDYTILPLCPNPVMGGSSQHLYDVVQIKRPRLHLFGHVLEQNGYWVKRNDDSYINEASGSIANPPSPDYPSVLMSNNAMINKNCDTIIRPARLILVPKNKIIVTGTLSVSCPNTLNTYRGTFQSDRFQPAALRTNRRFLTSVDVFEPADLDRTKDYLVRTSRDNGAVHIERRYSGSTYVGDVIPGANDGEYARHGKGTYECDRYRYDGDWVRDELHGHGHYKCKQSIGPFEVGDIYVGDFENGKPAGISIDWERPNIFRYSGEVRNLCPVKGVYQSSSDHFRSAAQWQRGWTYDGEFKDFMMHGKGMLTVTGINGIIIESKGTFINHTLDILRDFTKITDENNVLHMKNKVDASTYDGGVLRDASGAYIKHGRGIYDCVAYRYEGGWRRDERYDPNGRGTIFVCKRTKPEYSPFEAGDSYEGAFDNGRPSGTCIRWEHHGKFIFSGEMADGSPRTGMYESLSDHHRGNVILWEKGFKYEGQFQAFMMNGPGTLTGSDSTGRIKSKKKGHFANHQLDKSRDYRVLTIENDVVVKMEERTNRYYYDGDVIPGANDGEYARHGKGTYDCDRYRYDGDWVRDERHGHGHYKCKQSIGPFEVGDIYVGDFENGKPAGISIDWTRPDKFKYSGEFRDFQLIKGVYQSSSNHLIANSIEWQRGWTYDGEFKDFMMHGKGKLTNSTECTVSTGNFVGHNVDKTRDYVIETYSNGAVIKSESKSGDFSYNGDVQAQYGSSDLMKHGRGIYDCAAYRYEGGWSRDVRHGQDSKFECKQTITKYHPFEEGDVYQGGFNMRIPEGRCEWKRPNKFTYRGTMSNGRKDTGEEEDHITGTVVRYRDGDRE